MLPAGSLITWPLASQDAIDFSEVLESLNSLGQKPFTLGSKGVAQHPLEWQKLVLFRTDQIK